MARNFNWGIIGSGGIANAFAGDIIKLDDHGVKAVASRTEKSTRFFIQV